MKDIIEINGQKYKRVDNEIAEPPSIKGQDGTIVIMILFLILLIISLIFKEWISAVLCGLLMYLCGCLGIDALEDIRNRIAHKKT